MKKYLGTREEMDYNFELLSDTELLAKVDFSKIISESFSKDIEFTVQQTGNLNSVLLSSKVLVNKDHSISLGSTFSLSTFIAIPFTKRKVKTGDKIAISINYKYGGGFTNFFVDYIEWKHKLHLAFVYPALRDFLFNISILTLCTKA